MLKKQVFKVVVTGPESSGKTTLALGLSALSGAPCVPEFARYYLQYLDRPYTQADLQTIGRGQYAWEQWYSRGAEGLLLVDTDWTVLSIWEKFRFPALPVPFWQQGYGRPVPADFYILNTPDFPWQFDPLRENPDDQQALFALYRGLLEAISAPYLIVGGTVEHRLQQVRQALPEFFPSLP